jgi:hypothetical protein
MTLQQALDHLEKENVHLHFCVSCDLSYENIDTYLQAVNIVVEALGKLRTHNELLSSRCKLGETLYNHISLAYDDLWEAGVDSCEVS